MNIVNPMKLQYGALVFNKKSLSVFTYQNFYLALDRRNTSFDTLHLHYT